MTVTYQYDVASSASGGFIRLLFRWRGSVWKVVYREMLIFTVCYVLLSILYNFAFGELQQRIFERVVFFCATFMDLIPLSFMLGFYVSFIAARWWSQFVAIPWPDKLMNIVAMYIPGLDESSRVVRRTLMRYLNLSLVLVLRSISMAVKRRFPTKDHLIEAGFMTKTELEMFQSVPSTEFNTFWIPCTWFINVLREARQECRITDSNGLKLIMEELNEFRSKCGLLWGYDWISIPLVYTQVVTMATYAFYVACMFGRQNVTMDSTKAASPEVHRYDFYVPIFTILQLMFYMGLLKVAEQLINPFGDDDEDFELNWIIDRHMKVSYLGVDTLNGDPPPLVKDTYYNELDVKIPYTEASKGYKKKTYRGSVAYMQVPMEKQGMVVPDMSEEEEEDNETTLSESLGMRRPSIYSLFGARGSSNPSLDSFLIDTKNASGTLGVPQSSSVVVEMAAAEDDEMVLQEVIVDPPSVQVRPRLPKEKLKSMFGKRKLFRRLKGVRFKQDSTEDSDSESLLSMTLSTPELTELEKGLHPYYYTQQALTSQEPSRAFSVQQGSETRLDNEAEKFLKPARKLVKSRSLPILHYNRSDTVMALPITTASSLKKLYKTPHKPKRKKQKTKDLDARRNTLPQIVLTQCDRKIPQHLDLATCSHTFSQKATSESQQESVPNIDEKKSFSSTGMKNSNIKQMPQTSVIFTEQSQLANSHLHSTTFPPLERNDDILTTRHGMHSKPGAKETASRKNVDVPKKPPPLRRSSSLSLNVASQSGRHSKSNGKISSSLESKERKNIRQKSSPPVISSEVSVHSESPVHLPKEDTEQSQNLLLLKPANQESYKTRQSSEHTVITPTSFEKKGSIQPVSTTSLLYPLDEHSKFKTAKACPELKENDRPLHSLPTEIGLDSKVAVETQKEYDTARHITQTIQPFKHKEMRSSSKPISPYSHSETTVGKEIKVPQLPPKLISSSPVYAHSEPISTRLKTTESPRLPPKLSSISKVSALMEPSVNIPTPFDQTESPDLHSKHSSQSQPQTHPVLTSTIATVVGQTEGPHFHSKPSSQTPSHTLSEASGTIIASVDKKGSHSHLKPSFPSPKSAIADSFITTSLEQIESPRLPPKLSLPSPIDAHFKSTKPVATLAGQKDSQASPKLSLQSTLEPHPKPTTTTVQRKFQPDPKLTLQSQPQCTVAVPTSTDQKFDSSRPKPTDLDTMPQEQKGSYPSTKPGSPLISYTQPTITIAAPAEQKEDVKSLPKIGFPHESSRLTDTAPQTSTPRLSLTTSSKPDNLSLATKRGSIVKIAGISLAPAKPPRSSTTDCSTEETKAPKSSSSSTTGECRDKSTKSTDIPYQKRPHSESKGKK